MVEHWRTGLGFFHFRIAVNLFLLGVGPKMTCHFTLLGTYWVSAFDTIHYTNQRGLKHARIAENSQPISFKKNLTGPMFPNLIDWSDKPGSAADSVPD